MEEVLNISIKDLFERFSPEEVFGSKLAVIDMSGEEMMPPDAPARLDAFSIIIANKGEMTIDIDYLTYKIKKNMSLRLIAHCIVDNVKFSRDFRGHQVVVSKELVREIVSGIDEIPNAPGGPPRMNPVLNLEEKDARILSEHIQRIRAGIADKEHPFYKRIIRNELEIFLMKFLYIQSKEIGAPPGIQKVGHKEDIVRQFLMLLIENYKQEHEVTFYSNELCITPEYLSKIMKGFSGKTVNKWIADALISEAKICLRRPDATIQQVAEELNFSDQSYFGKFFKKHTGKSPVEYRNALLK